MMPNCIKNSEKTTEDYEDKEKELTELCLKRETPEPVTPQISQVLSGLDLESFEVTFQELYLHGKSNSEGAYHLPTHKLGKTCEDFFNENILSWAKEIGNLPEYITFVNISHEQDLKLSVYFLKDILELCKGNEYRIFQEMKRNN